MLCAVIRGPTFEEAHLQIAQAVAYADLVELRLDYFHSLDIDALKVLRSHSSLPMIFTLKSHMQGGGYDMWCRLVELNPEYLDLESHVSASLITKISSHCPATKLILSYHNFTDTPEDLERIYQEMQRIPASFYKIAVTAQNCVDALRLVNWAKKKTEDNLIAISMGSYGQVSRILGPVMRSPITYASLEEELPSAPGQFSAKTVSERYHYHSLNSQTALYGLIGDPIDQSISDRTHNHLMEALNFDAVYVKIQVPPSELSDFLRLAKELPFHGLSVTMPLKEAILPFLDEIDPEALDIGAVNTLLFKEGRVFGFNTDGVGCLNAIESAYPVKDKRIVIIGAGGASRAIAYEAHKRGGHVSIVNRDKSKACQIAERLHCRGGGLDYMASCAERGYDILINCTPSPLPIQAEYILPQAIVMDIVTRPKETLFLKLARERGCPVIYGYRMFIEQALGQFNLWFNEVSAGYKKLNAADTFDNCYLSAGFAKLYPADT